MSGTLPTLYSPSSNISPSQPHLLAAAKVVGAGFNFNLLLTPFTNKEPYLWISICPWQCWARKGCSRWLCAALARKGRAEALGCSILLSWRCRSDVASHLLCLCHVRSRAGGRRRGAGVLLGSPLSSMVRGVQFHPPRCSSFEEVPHPVQCFHLVLGRGRVILIRI